MRGQEGLDVSHGSPPHVINHRFVKEAVTSCPLSSSHGEGSGGMGRSKAQIHKWAPTKRRVWGSQWQTGDLWAVTQQEGKLEDDPLSAPPCLPHGPRKGCCERKGVCSKLGRLPKKGRAGSPPGVENLWVSGRGPREAGVGSGRDKAWPPGNPRSDSCSHMKGDCGVSSTWECQHNVTRARGGPGGGAHAP